MHKAILFCIAIIVSVLAFQGAGAEGQVLRYSDIRADEQLVFFRTSAWLDEERQEWHLPIHGWIYEPESSLLRKSLFKTVLEEEYDLEIDADAEANFSRRLELMIADSERAKSIVVSLAGRDFTLPPSTANGQIITTLVMPIAELEAHIENGRVGFSAATRATDSREFFGEVLLVDPVGFGIISDIDDTVKISEVVDRTKLLEHSFLLDFAAVPGMADVYNKWSNADTSLHFVSSSPWQFYSPLSEFLERAGFSNFVFRLKPVRFRDQTLFDLFKKGTETKPKVIEKILETYPQRQFVLVGDSGEHDPEVYALIARKYPSQVLRIFIRNVTGETPVNARFRQVFEGLDDDLWRLFDDPATMMLPGSAE